MPATRKGLEDADRKVAQAARLGAKMLVGGPGALESRPSLKPTILLGVKKDMEVSDEETFGPSASLYTFKTDREAIEMANDSEYGLNAAIHSTNMERAIQNGAANRSRASARQQHD